MYSIEKIKKIIQINFPTFEIKDVSFIGEGWDSCVYRINQEYIFRFPKYEKVSENLKKEICLLPKLKNHLNISIPNFEFVGKKSKVFDKYFVGYKAMLGVPLTRNVFDQLSDYVKEEIAKQIAHFLETMHSIPPEEVKECGVEKLDFERDYEDDLRNMQDKVFPKLSKLEREWVTRLFKGYLNEEENFKFKPSLLHNDLSADHIFFDIEQNRITSIIGFGDVAIGDSDYDLMYLIDDYGGDFIEILLRYYHHENLSRLIQKLKFFQSCDPIHTILGGIHLKDEDKIRDGLKSLKERIAANK